jgi:hypothetical protein
MSTEVAVAEDNMMCCASCGIAPVDDVKLKKCACNLVKYCSALTARKTTDRSIKSCVRKEWLNYVMINYLKSLKEVVSVTARFVVCRCQMIG